MIKITELKTADSIREIFNFLFFYKDHSGRVRNKKGQLFLKLIFNRVGLDRKESLAIVIFNLPTEVINKTIPFSPLIINHKNIDLLIEIKEEKEIKTIEIKALDFTKNISVSDLFQIAISQAGGTTKKESEAVIIKKGDLQYEVKEIAGNFVIRNITNGGQILDNTAPKTKGIINLYKQKMEQK